MSTSNNVTNSAATFRKGTPITVRDRKFVNALKRALVAAKSETPGLSNALISRQLGFHKDYLGRIINLTERPSRETAEALAVMLGFSSSQMRYYGSYFKNLPPATKPVATRIAEVRNSIVQAMSEYGGVSN